MNFRELIEHKSWKALLKAIDEGCSPFPITAREYASLKIQIAKLNTNPDYPYRFSTSYNFDTAIVKITKIPKSNDQHKTTDTP